MGPCFCFGQRLQLRLTGNSHALSILSLPTSLCFWRQILSYQFFTQVALLSNSVFLSITQFLAVASYPSTAKLSRSLQLFLSLFVNDLEIEVYISRD